MVCVVSQRPRHPPESVLHLDLNQLPDKEGPSPGAGLGVTGLALRSPFRVLTGVA